MENDSQAIAVGLGAGLGGFIAFVCIRLIENQINSMCFPL